MLTENEEKYLLTIPLDKRIHIKPFSSKQNTIAEAIMNKIKAKHPNIVIKHMGASGLGISGQGDLDIYALVEPIDFDKFIPTFIEYFGKPSAIKSDFVSWDFEIDGYPIELYISDPNTESMQSQMRVFEILKENRDIRNEYESLKSSMNGKSFREYQKKKYEFYHKILGEDSN